MARRASIIVRSMARPELSEALASLAAQTHDDVEVVLVDATGGRHPPPPPTCGPHRVLFVGGDAPRSRPVAANAGLDAATGDYIGFLDDDDRLLPDHVSGLAAALDAQPGYAVAYAQATEVGSDGAVVGVRAEPFSRVLLFQDSYVMLQAALFRCELRDTCRFDPAFDVFEDWDFWIQASRVTDFLPVAQRTVIYRSDLGRSGIGRGPNRDPAIVEAYRRRIAAKWRVEGERAMRELQQHFDAASAHFAAGDRARAEAAVREVLGMYRFHVGALVLAGTLAALRGAFPEASSHFALAARESPADAGVHFNLAQSLEREGRADAAAASYRRVLELEPSHPHARVRLAHIEAAPRG
jgi:glycosyltransferase involved in cell wall biosynthesis